MEKEGGFNYFNPTAEEAHQPENVLPSESEKEEISSLDEILGGFPGGKLVPFSGKAAILKEAELKPPAETESFSLAEVSEMGRKFLDPKIQDQEKSRILRIINEARREIKLETGAKEVFFGFDGDISLIYSDGRTEKIFDNPSLPIFKAVKEEQAEFFFDDHNSKAENEKNEGAKNKEKEFQVKDFNISEPFVDVEAAQFFAKDSGYLDLSKTPFCSKEVLRALQPRTGLINLLGLESEKIDNEAREILKYFSGKVLLRDDLRRKIDKGE